MLGIFRNYSQVRTSVIWLTFNRARPHEERKGEKEMKKPTMNYSPVKIFYKSDGSEMYITWAENDFIYKYSLSIPFDRFPTEDTSKYIGKSKKSLLNRRENE